MERNEKMDLIHEIISEAEQKDLFKVAERKNSIIVASFDYNGYGDKYQTGWVIFSDKDDADTTESKLEYLREKTMWNHPKTELV